MRRRIVTILALIGICLGSPRFEPPAHAFGGVVFDPTNLAQNILTAARSLEQINNQIGQLQNEAQMLINQAEDLASLNFTSAAELERILTEIAKLLGEADEITYETERSRTVFAEKYPDDYGDLSNSEIVIRAQDQWKISQNAFRKAIILQSGIVTSITEARTTMTRLINESQSATGNLQVSQAGNQLMALSVEQQMQMQSLMAAQYRMITLEEARRAAIEEQARIHHERFRGDGSAYTRQ